MYGKLSLLFAFNESFTGCLPYHGANFYCDGQDKGLCICTVALSYSRNQSGGVVADHKKTQIKNWIPYDTTRFHSIVLYAGTFFFKLDFAQCTRTIKTSFVVCSLLCITLENGLCIKKNSYLNRNYVSSILTDLSLVK